MGYTLAEKIIMNNLGLSDISVGDIVVVKPDFVGFHDIYTPSIYNKFKEMGFDKIWDPEKVVNVLDHLVIPCLPGDPNNLNYSHKISEEFKPKYFFKNEGITHQLFPELGLAKPGSIVFVTDSHTTTYGAVGCFATGVGHTEMAALLGTGKMWIKVPSAIKVEINGKLQEGVTSKDLILKVLGDIRADGGTYKSIEFCGSTVDAMSIDSRLTISNMVVECGGKVGLFAPDEKTCAYSGIDYDSVSWLTVDEDAHYEQVIKYDASLIEPQISCPQYVDNVHGISEVIGTKVNEVFIGSCTNGRLEDFMIAASILKGKKVAKGIKFIVSAASTKVYKEAIEKGYIESLLRAGAMVTHPYCSLCQGRSGGIVSDGEVVLGTNNRNFLGRMGSPNSLIYLSSPAVAAASALTGYITDPRPFL